jgi:hypothetical protein
MTRPALVPWSEVMRTVREQIEKEQAMTIQATEQPVLCGCGHPEAIHSRDEYGCPKEFCECCWFPTTCQNCGQWSEICACVGLARDGRERA